jgi:hypothetical protein
MPYSDGTFPSGSPVITINAITYKANSFTVNRNANTVNITDNVGDPSGALSFNTPMSGSTELQFSANSTAEPTTAAQNSTTGVFIANINSVNVNCFITSCTVNKPKDAPWTASVNWQQKINA